VIERIDDMPTGAIGFQVTGELSDADYAEVLAPALREAAGAGDVRLLLAADKGFDLGTLKSRFEELRSDPELDLGHSKDWKRVAIAADANFIYRAAFPALSQVVPVDIKLFGVDDVAEAKAWVVG
jgi:hypothetical protein